MKSNATREFKLINGVFESVRGIWDTNLMKPITHIKTPFKEKFGVPRQSLIVSEAIGEMIFPKNDFFSEAFRGIESSTHMWLIFEFDKIPEQEFSGLVRPPRFEGKKKLGIYATRTPHRPNRLGLSVVKFHSYEVLNDSIRLLVEGVDLVDGTPILDIKPYVPYTDCQLEARTILFEEPQSFKVDWVCPIEVSSSEKILIEKIIALDPRPSYDKETNDLFGVSIAGFNVRFKFSGNKFLIEEVIKE